MRESLTLDTIAFLMEAVVEGRLDRVTARCLVAPWVEGDAVATESGVLSGATTLHGLDLVNGDAPGLVHHASWSETDFLIDDDEVRSRCSTWFQRWRPSGA